MVQNSYTILTAAIIFLISLILLTVGLIRRNKAVWIPALVSGLISGGYILIIMVLFRGM